MRAALIHGLLLAVMLVYGYRTWTRDKSVKPDRGSVVLWNKTEAEVAAVEYKTEKKTVRLEQRSDAGGAYWWGVETTIDKRPKPIKAEDKPATPPAGAGSAAGSAAGSGAGSAVAAAGSAAGSGAGSAAGSAAAPPTPPPPPEMEEVKKVVEYPIGEGGTKLLDGYYKARAVLDLGVPTDALKKDYKLDTATTTLTVSFKDNSKREFLVGGSTYNNTGGSSDRYVMDKQSGKAYVLSKDLLGNLETGQSSLHLADPRGFEASLISTVEIKTEGRSKAAARVTTGAEGQQVKTWGDPATKKADQTLANFIDNAANLRPTEYKAQLKVESLTPVVSLTYKDERGGKLGTLSLYKMEKAAEVPEGTDFDPANPPKGETEYYVVTEKTRVPGIVRKDTAQRTEQDIPVVFGEAPPKEVKSPGAEFENVPLPPMEKGSAAPPGGAPPGGPPPGVPGLPGAIPPGAIPGAGSAPAPGAPGAPGAPKAGSAAAPAPGAPKAPTPPAPAAGSAAGHGAHDGHAH